MDILRGIKQENPLSSLIFNLILDPIKGKLEMTESIRNRFRSSIFNDDLVLQKKDIEVAEKQNTILNEYLQKVNIKFPPSNAQFLKSVARIRCGQIEDTQLTMGQQITYADPENIIKYLRAILNPLSRLCKVSVKTKDKECSKLR